MKPHLFQPPIPQPDREAQRQALAKDLALLIRRRLRRATVSEAAAGSTASTPPGHPQK